MSAKTVFRRSPLLDFLRSTNIVPPRSYCSNNLQKHLFSKYHPMQHFKLTLSNNATVTGIHSIPPPSVTSPIRHRPLIITLHGGTYNCHYFDGTPESPASVAGTALRIPLISIVRPCHGVTSSFLPVPEGSDYNHETGSWLHRYIPPAL